MTVIYHADCADGFMAAYLLWLIKPAASFYAAKYGDPLPEINDLDETVFIVDFSYPEVDLRALAERVSEVLVFDHHISAIRKLAGVEIPNVKFFLDEARCGSKILLDYLASIRYQVSYKVHELVGYVQDRDLWQWKLHRSKSVSSFIAAMRKDFHEWDNAFAKNGISEMADIGDVLLVKEKQMVERMGANAIEYTFNGMKYISVNSPVLQSEIGAYFATIDRFVSIWYVDGSGKYVYSLRSLPGGADVSKIAETFGGGGHTTSAGFKVDVNLESL